MLAAAHSINKSCLASLLLVLLTCIYHIPCIWIEHSFKLIILIINICWIRFLSLSLPILLSTPVSVVIDTWINLAECGLFSTSFLRYVLNLINPTFCYPRRRRGDFFVNLPLLPSSFLLFSSFFHHSTGIFVSSLSFS